MTAVLFTLGVVAFAVGIAASIGLHELGHLYPAKRFGVKVTQYFVGFGRTVWSTRRGETESLSTVGGVLLLAGFFYQRLSEAGRERNPAPNSRPGPTR